MSQYYFSMRDGDDFVTTEFNTTDTEELSAKLNKFLSMCPTEPPESPSIYEARKDVYSELQRAYADGTDPSEETRLERLVDSFDEVIEYLFGLENAQL